MDGEEHRLFGLQGSASVRDGTLTISAVSPSPSEPIEAVIELRGAQAQTGTVAVLAHPDIRAHSTFEAPDLLRPQVTPLALDGGEWRHTFAPASVTVITARLA